MLKFFRKYLLNKAVLVIIGSFLMVMFLLPGTEIFMPDPANRPVGQLRGETIRQGEVQTAAAEMHTLARMGFGQNLPAEELTWVLLIREARQNGIYVSDAAVRGVIDDMVEAQINPYAAAEAAGVSEQLVFQAIRHFMMVSELQNMIFNVRRPSEPRLAHFARDTGSTATADVVIIDADHLLDQVDPPSEAEMESHFQQYRDVRPGESEPFGFGYFLPPRVQLEYLAVPLDRVKAEVEIDEVEAQRYYMDHEQRYTPAALEDVADLEIPEDHPDDEPLDYRQVRDRVYADLRDERGRRMQNEIVRWMAGNFTQQERRLPVDQHGYRDLPDDYQPLSFEEIAQQVQDRYGVLPDVVRLEDQWLGPEDVAEIDGLGQAFLEASNRRFPVEDYIFSARELEPDPDHGLLALRLQAHIASRTLEDDRDNRYIFRLLDADPPREPHDLDEVRDQVATDLTRQRAYEMLLERQQELRLQAIEDGLEPLAEQFDTEVRTLENFQGRVTVAGRMQPPDLPGIGRSAAFVDQLFATAHEAYDEAGSIDDAEAGQLTTAVGVNQRQVIAVARLRAYQPLNQEIYQMLRPHLPQQLHAGDASEIIQRHNPFDPDTLKPRIGFVEADAPDADDADQGHLH